MKKYLMAVASDIKLETIYVRRGNLLVSFFFVLQFPLRFLKSFTPRPRPRRTNRTALNSIIRTLVIGVRHAIEGISHCISSESSIIFTSKSFLDSADIVYRCIKCITFFKALRLS